MLVSGLISRPFDDPLVDPGADLSVVQSALAKPIPRLLAGVLDQILQQPFGRHDEQHVRTFVEHGPHESVGFAGAGRRRHQPNVLVGT